ncbi:MAG: septum formation initiator family protein [Oscillospiraceae bacterium]|jgi:cell division protein FtsB|nr:septum formation initiator family protein [Oscillospiraceae bacterium]
MIILKKSRKISTIIKSAVFIFVLYSMFNIVEQQAQIFSKKRELEKINSDLISQKLKNDELKKIVILADKKNDEYIEHIARDTLGFIRQNERVFINIAGD